MSKRRAAILSIIFFTIEALIFCNWSLNEDDSRSVVPGLGIVVIPIVLGAIILAHGLIFLIAKLLFRRYDLSFLKYLFLLNLILWPTLFILDLTSDINIFGL